MIAASPVFPHELESTVAGALPADELHVTLVYLGEIVERFDLMAARTVLTDLLATFGVDEPPSVMVDNAAEFGGGNAAPGEAVVLLVSSPELAVLRPLVVDAMSALGYEDASSFADEVWRPHLTIGYAPVGSPEHALLLDHARAAVGMSVPLSGVVVAAGVANHEIPFNMRKAAAMTCACETKTECGCQPKTGGTTARVAAYDYRAIADMIPVDDVPAAYFEPPAGMSASTKMAIALDGPLPGHLYGVVAPRGRCLLDGQPGCWTVDDLQLDDPNLAFVHQGDVRLADGSLFKISALSGDIGHAPGNLTPAQARDWMGATGTQFGRVRYSYTAAGLVAAGIVWPEIVANQRLVAGLRASPSSLDARWLSGVAFIKDEGHYALCGAVFVNSPGLPIARAASFGWRSDRWLSFDGENLTIVDGEPRTAAADPGQSTGTPAQTQAAPPPPDPAMNPAALPGPVDPVLLDRIMTLEGNVNRLQELVEAIAKAELVRQDDLVAGLPVARSDGLASDLI